MLCYAVLTCMKALVGVTGQRMLTVSIPMTE